MAREARQRISYVLPLASSPGGHRLGVNGLVVDTDEGILYSGGRDGLLCAWDLNFDLNEPRIQNEHAPCAPGKCHPRHQNTTVFRQQVQAHTHWVNDITLAQTNSALISASSDLTVKVWRPHSEEGSIPATIGLHSDYVKCLATPGTHSEWIASGGLDHKIRLWDLDGGGEMLQIDAGESERSAKSSVYALSVKGSVLASGGPESVVRLWDPRSGKRITNFVGHTDNIRDILLNEDCDTVMSASSDQSIKVWSITAGRCMYTLTMHNDSVWSLYSDHPKLSLFYSSDRSGMIAKTDVRDCEDMDEGLSLAIGKEQEGVTKVVAAGANIWTATSSSSINRWRDVDTEIEVQLFEPMRLSPVNNLSSRQKAPSHLVTKSSLPMSSDKPKVPLNCVLRISTNAPIPGQSTKEREASTIYSEISARDISEAFAEKDIGIYVPYHDLPEETIEGQNGLIKHVILNDRRRVLTLDTTGEVTLWDLLQCSQIISYGKQHLDDVRPKVDKVESVANWCSVDTQTGRLVVVLEKNYCFDAEVYADELDLKNAHDFRDDQRINLGKWVLRYLFSRLIDVEIERDRVYRENLLAREVDTGNRSRPRAPSSFQTSIPVGRPKVDDSQDDTVTPKITVAAPSSPGGIIGSSVSQTNGASTNNNSHVANNAPNTVKEGSKPEERASPMNATRTSTDRSSDYLSNNMQVKSATDGQANPPTSQNEAARECSTTTSTVDANHEKGGSSLFGKKFRMNFPKKLGRSSVEVKQSAVDEKSEESEKLDYKDDRSNDLYLLGTLDEIRSDYGIQMQINPSQELFSGINPSMPNDTPKLCHPPYTTVIIQVEQADAGGISDLYRGTVSSVGKDVDVIERCAPRWLGDLLLRNQLPEKEFGKVSFVLLPYNDLLPSIASSDGNTRLTANRMLRAKKVLSYVAERIETLPTYSDADALKPEEYLDLYCQNQLVEHNATLATLRAHVWKTGGDVVLYYKSNGKKPEIEEILAKRAAAVTAAEISGKVGPTIQT